MQCLPVLFGICHSYIHPISAMLDVRIMSEVLFRDGIADLYFMEHVKCRVLNICKKGYVCGKFRTQCTSYDNICESCPH